MSVDHVVVRRAPDLPASFLTGSMDGRWFDMATMRQAAGDGVAAAAIGDGIAVAVPTGRFEVRDDGAVAEVYEIRL